MAENQCNEYVDTEILDRYSLIPAFVIVIILHAFQYYKEKKLELVPPFLSLIGDKNKKMVAIGFGAMTYSILMLIIKEEFKAPANTWGQITLQMLLFVLKLLVIAIINYPIFMFSQFDYKFISSILGECYTLYRFILLMLQNTYLKNCPKKVYKAELGMRFAMIFPNFICYLVLIIIFLMNIVKCIKQRNFGKNVTKATIASEKDLKHFREMISKYKIPAPSSIPSRFVRIVKDTSKLSTTFLLAIVVILIMYYYAIYSCVIIGKVLGELKSPDYYSVGKDNSASSKLVEVLLKSVVEAFTYGHGIGTTVAFFMYFGILFQLIRSHERDLKDLFAGKRTIHGEMENLHPQSLTMSNIVFPGFLVAYMVWGLLSLYIVVMLCSAVVSFIALVAVKSNLVDQFLLKFAKSLYRILLVPGVVYIVQWLMTKFLFCQRNSNQFVMIRNIKLYHMTIYFNFFYNIVMGVFSCLKRSLTSFAISFLFLGRIDRTSFVFFKKFDAGYRAYIGFMRFEALYKNPLMRCFIQFLHDSTNWNGNDFFQQEAMGEQMANIKSRRARNRWQLAYTLIHNQSLINERVHQKPSHRSFIKELDDDRGSIYSETCSQKELLFT